MWQSIGGWLHRLNSWIGLTNHLSQHTNMAKIYSLGKCTSSIFAKRCEGGLGCSTVNTPIHLTVALLLL